MAQLGLFPSAPEYPLGFRYMQDAIAPDDEARLLEQIAPLPFKEFEFHGYTGKRRVVSFGWRYDFGDRALHKVDDIPAFLLPLRATTAHFAELTPNELQHVLVTEYGAGAARTEWEHSIPAVDALRYSITFRNLRERG